ncbi:MAG: lysophospholipid acyltransferase family protein [Planctomycetes bacterium]|nr:lysophospholipid acyltransferase family protein [Planctomycetota bacterium]
MSRHARAARLAAMPKDGPRTWPAYALLTCLTAFVAVWPAPLAYAASRALGVALALLTRWRDPRLARRRRGVQRNMRLAFGDALDDRARRALVHAYGRHLAWLLLEVLRLRRLTPRRARRLVDVRAFEQVRALLAEGKGVIVASGHMGNWELLACAAGVMGFRQVVLARPLPEPGAERWLKAHRERSGQRVLSKFGGLWALKKALDRGGVVGLNVDENARDGLFVPFGTRLAGTNATAAHLQRVSGAPIVVLTCQRLAPERFRAHVWAVIRPDPTAGREAETARVTAEVARGLEAALRAHPEQWLWSLRRWETRPPGEVEGPDGLPPPVSPPPRPAA